MLGIIELNRIGALSCNVLHSFPIPARPYKEYEIPLRRADGRMHRLEAKNLGLSSMMPDELEGLQNTFSAMLDSAKIALGHC